MEEIEKNRLESNQQKMDSKGQNDNQQREDHKSGEIKNIGSFYISSLVSRAITGCCGSWIGGGDSRLYRIIGSILDTLVEEENSEKDSRNNRQGNSKYTEEKKKE